jgi:hypothetical protein
MTQLHKRFTDEQLKVLLEGYCQGVLSAVDVQAVLDISRSHFFALLERYRHDPESFTIAYQRTTRPRLSTAVEAEIERALRQEQAIVEDPRLPISGYNYSALRDRLAEQGIHVSLNTIIQRAKALDCYRPRRKREAHDREVVPRQP